MPPAQGLLLDWRQHAYCRSAVVVTVRIDEHGPVVVQEWVEVERLKPIRSDSNGRQLGGYSGRLARP